MSDSKTPFLVTKLQLGNVIIGKAPASKILEAGASKVKPRSQARAWEREKARAWEQELKASSLTVLSPFSSLA